MTSEKTKILLHAEDDAAHAAIVRLAIQRNMDNVQLMQVGDGKAALDYLYRRGSYQDHALSPRPDLILLDIRMPQVSGLEVLAIAKQDAKLRDIPVAVLTTSDAEEDRFEADARGVDSYLTKPVDYDKFTGMIKQLCADFLH